MSKQIIQANAGLYWAEVTYTEEEGMLKELWPIIGWEDGPDGYLPLLAGGAMCGLVSRRPKMTEDFVDSVGVWDSNCDLYTFAGCDTSESYQGSRELLWELERTWYKAGKGQ